jgi:hypothetical protein
MHKVFHISLHVLAPIFNMYVKRQYFYASVKTHKKLVCCLFPWASAESHGCTAGCWLIVPPALDVPTLATRLSNSHCPADGDDRHTASIQLSTNHVISFVT